MNMKATSFATRQDLAAFSACVTRGSSVEDCLNVGDNGVGKWGDATWEPDAVPPIVALPAPATRGSLWEVKFQGITKECVCKDRSPSGVVDFSPSALKAFGLSPDDELLSTADVEPIE